MYALYFFQYLLPKNYVRVWIRFLWNVLLISNTYKINILSTINTENYLLSVITIAQDGSNRLLDVDIIGCQRRTAYDFQKETGRKVDFTCIGEEGPPCTVKIGEGANFTATFSAGKWL